MEKQFYNPSALAKPSGYNHGILLRGGRLLFLAGQPGLDVNGNVASPGDMVAQFTQAVMNMQAVVQEAGGSLTDIVKLTIFVTDKQAYKSNLKPIGAAHKSLFGRYYPATTLVECKSLFDDDALIELDAIAVLQD